mgnify:FL=1
MSTYLGYLECPRCKLQATEEEAFWGCASCRQEGLPVNIHPVYDLEGLIPDWQDSVSGIFRYQSLLPITGQLSPVSLGEGSTPLIHLAELGARIGLDNLFIKDETRNPTWSYKDRLAAVAVNHARESGATTVVVATTGNHGAAVAAYAAAAGLKCVILTLESVPAEMKVLMQVYGAQVVALSSGPERWQLMRSAVEAFGWTPMSGLADPPVGSNPFGIDGYKSIAYELVEDLGRQPDCVVVPTAYGDGLTGIYRGFLDLRDLGMIDSIPKMMAAEPLGPYTTSLQDGGEMPSKVLPRNSVAFSIASPVATYQGLQAIRHSGGTAITVGDDSTIIQAQIELAEAGLFLEASAAICLPAVTSLAGTTLSQEDLVVLLATSSGLKGIGDSASVLAEVPTISPDLDELSRIINVT